MTSGNRHDELRAHLQSRIPRPAPGYWEAIDERLAQSGENGTAAARSRSGIDAATGDSDGTERRDPGEAASSDTPWWRNSRVLVAAAALLLVAALVVVVNRSSDDGLEQVIAAGQSAGDAADAASGDQQQASTGDAASAVDGGAAANPLAAVQTRLGAADADAIQNTSDSAGPFCFSSDDAYVFPANELVDRRALAWVEVSFDGFLNLFALQGDDILVSASGYPTESGVLATRPFAEAGSSGELPPYTITLTDSSIAFSPEGPPLDLVSCADVQGRVERIFALLASADPVDNGVDWPASDAVLSSAGLGPIRVGMAVSELSAQLGTTLVIETIDGNAAGECGWVADSDSISSAVWLLVELTSASDGIIRRVSVTDGRWFTPSGMNVGVSEQTVIDTFPGQIESSPHVYVDGTYLTYQPANANDPNTVQFVNEGGTVVDIRAGDRNWVGLVEGCA